MEIARRHLHQAELEELLTRNPNAVIEIDGKQVDGDWLREQLEQTAEMVERAQKPKLMPRPTVDEPAFHEGTRNQRRVQKKLLRKIAKAGKRR